MSYIDGFVIPVPTKNLAAYTKMAKLGGKIWMEHGALAYCECVGDDLDVKFGMPFTKCVKVKPDETVVFAYIVYKSRAHRDKVNAKVMADPRMHPPPGQEMPFELKRMVFGGFKSIVDL